MKNLSKLKLKTRLFMIMIFSLVAIAVIAVYTLNAMTRVGSIIDTINAHPLIVSNTAADSQLIVAGILQSYQEAFIDRDPSRKAYHARKIAASEDLLDEKMRTIQSLILGDEGQELARETTAIIDTWRIERDGLIDDFYDADARESSRVVMADSELNGTATVQRQLGKIQNYAKNNAKSLATEADRIRAEAWSGIAVMAALLAIMLYSFTLLIIRNVSESLGKLQSTMAESAEQDRFLKAELVGENEIVDVSRYYNKLIEKLEIQFEMKTGLSELSSTVSGHLEMGEFAGKTISFLCEYTQSGNGVFYLFDEAAASLELVASYAFHEKQKLMNRVSLGESLIGQAALDRKPILVRNVTKDEALITSGLISEPPLNSIALPLVFEDRLCGVIELSSFEPFDTVKMAYLNAAAEIIAVSVYAAMQQEKIHQLLDETKKANVLLEIQQQEVIAKSEELAQKNEFLSELLTKSELQGEELQVQQEELRQNNEELEKQARALRESEEKLQLQQEELRITNEELQKYTLQLVEQKRVLNEKNSALAAAQEEMLKKAAALEKVNTYKSEFLANMSHELRTPLNSIMVLSELLIQKKVNTPLTERETEFAAIINASGQDLLTMINGVLDLAKVEAGKLEIQNEKVCLSELLTEHRRMFEPLADTKKLGLRFSIDPFIPEFIETDAMRLSQIIKNLISNAIKFTHTGHVAVDFRPLKGNEGWKLTSPASDYIAIAVKDTGIGIPPEKMQEIFEAFKQSDGTTSRQYGGTGLGLTISMELAKLLGGDILHESEVGAGSEFILILPIKSTPEETVPEFFSPTELAEEHTGRETAVYDIPTAVLKSDMHSAPVENDKKMLIIEDDATFAQLLADLAEEKGYTAIKACTGEEGIRQAQTVEPTGIILDIGLPDIDGMVVAQILSEDEKTAAIPIHILSGSEEISEAMVFEDTPKSIIGFLKKPVDIKTIYRTLSKIENADLSILGKVLIVGSCGEEDFEEFAQLEQVRVKRVATGQEAFNELAQEHYGCIVLDVRLPDMHGIDFMKALHEKTATPVQLIIYTDEAIQPEDIDVIGKYTETIILKSSKSRDRLVDEVLLFLHSVQRNSKTKRSRTTIIEEEKKSLAGVRVLLADDNQRNVLALMSLLAMHGVHVVVARDGMDAVKKFEENDVDLILMDIMMPNMDGYEAIRQIRDNVKGRKTPIIALTAKAMMGDRDKCISAGANDYLTKPVESGRLLSMIKVWQA